MKKLITFKVQDGENEYYDYGIYDDKHTDDEINYTYHAYRYNRPDFIEYDEIPYVKKGSPRLEIIFDAFDEICNRLKNKYERSISNI